MKLRNILISLMMIISLSACEGEIELKTVLGNDRITINAVVDTDTVVFAFISEATAFDPKVTNGIFSIAVIVPAIGFALLALILWFWYPLHKKQVDANISTLKAKRGE